MNEKQIKMLEDGSSIDDIIRENIKECIDIIETYRVPVGNSSAGELSAEWTIDALKEIRDEIKDRFGIE